MAALVEPKQGFASLERSLWPAYSLGRRLGLADRGTYNPSATLPEGGKSDHAYYPARAFDLGFLPPVGYLHPIARTFFEAMIGRPEVNYVILGDVLWSQARGRRRYTAGGHLDHVHVSAVPGAVATDRRSGRPSSGAVYARAELERLWVAAGGNPRSAPMAAAVALRESGGNPRARALTKREDSRGLWQINVRAHPEWALRDLFDPRLNARAAVRISRNGADWSPWTTAARARQDLLAGGARRGVVRPGGEIGSEGGLAGLAGDVLGKATGIFKPLWQWGEALVAFVAFIVDPLNWLRLVEVVLGFALILIGLAALIVLFARQASPLGRAAGAAASPLGRAGASLRSGV